MQLKTAVMRGEIGRSPHLLPPYMPIKIMSGVDWYGFSRVLAKQCGRRVVPRSFANWVHGWTWHEDPTVELLACSRLPNEVTIVVRNEKERAVLIDAGFQDVRIGGLPFAYVPRQHESRHEDALLAFPPHSAGAQQVTADQRLFMDYLESLKNDFEAIHVSVYYLDMGGPMHKAALARGLRVIQGARPDDANSLVRLRSILDSFRYVTSNVMGSHMLYSIFAGCSFSFCGPKYGYDESVYLGAGNPFDFSTDFVQKILELQSEPYLRKRFDRFFVDNPRMGIEDLPFSEEAIGMRFTMLPHEIEDALGWSVAGQLRGYISGARRRMARVIVSNTSRK